LTAADGSRLSHLEIGNFGEKVAVAWLRANRYHILAKNFRGPRKGEVDIVARHGRLLLFIEVKTRRAGTPIRPLDAVTREKQRLIERGANAWLRKLGTREIPWRFDVIEVYLEPGEKPRVVHIRDAF
jgi:putative endonuclease